MHPLRSRIPKFAAQAIALLGLCSCGTAPEVARQTYLDKGDKLFAEGKFGEAALNYRKSIQKDPGFGAAYYRLGLAELNQRHFLDAYQALSRAVELAPRNEDAAVKLADLCMTAYTLDPRRPAHLRARLTGAIDQLAKQNRKGFNTLRLKGQLALLDRDLPGALEQLRAANRIKPMQPAVVLPLVQVLFDSNEAQQAEELGKAMIEQQNAFGSMYDVLYLHYMAGRRYADAEALLVEKVHNNPYAAEFIIQLASHYAAFNRRQEMTTALQRMLDDPRHFPRAHLQVGDFYAAHGDLHAALKQFQEALRENPADFPSCRKRIAALLARLGRPTEALSEYDALLRESPDDQESLRLRAELWIESRRPEQIQASVSQFQQLIAKSPDDPALRFDLGRAYEAMGDAEAARREFLRVLKISRDHNGSRLELARLCLRAKEPQQALGFLNDFVARDPGNAQGRLLRSIALMETGQLAEARTELTALRRDHSDLQEAQLQLGFLNIADKRYEEAGDIFRELYRPGQTDIRPLRGLVESQVARKQFDAAFQLLSQELPTSPRPTDVRRLLADAAVRAGRYDLALQHYQILAAVNPNSSDLQVRLGDVCQQRGDLAEAIRHFRRAAQLDPQSGATLMRLAYAVDAAGSSQEALANYRRCLELDPANPVVQNNLAFALADSNQDLDLAMKLALEAQQKLPDSPGVVDTLGWVYLKKGLHDSALKVFQNLVRKYPSDPRFWYHLALARLEKGDRKQARAELQKALANNPPKGEQEKIRKLMDRIG